MQNELVAKELDQHPACKFWNSIFRSLPKVEVGHKYWYHETAMDVTPGFYLTNGHGYTFVQSHDNIARLFTKSHGLDNLFRLKKIGMNIVVDKESGEERFVLLGKIGELVDGHVVLVNRNELFIGGMNTLQMGGDVEQRSEPVSVPNVVVTEEKIVKDKSDDKSLISRIETLEAALANLVERVIELTKCVDETKKSLEKVKPVEMAREMVTGSIVKEMVKQVNLVKPSTVIPQAPVGRPVVDMTAIRERVRVLKRQKKGVPFIVKKLSISDEEVKEILNTP